MACSTCGNSRYGFGCRGSIVFCGPENYPGCEKRASVLRRKLRGLRVLPQQLSGKNSRKRKGVKFHRLSGNIPDSR